MYKVYVKLDSNNYIIGVESTAFYNEQDLLEKGYILVDEGDNGDIYGHAQPNYLTSKYGKRCYDESFKANFKCVGGEVIPLTDEEKAALFPSVKPLPTSEEIQNELNIDIDYRLSCLELGLI